MDQCYGTKMGSNGTNEVGIVNLKRLTFNHPSVQINDYKKYVRENLKKNIRETELRNFVSSLEKNETVQKLYDPFGLVNEFYGLEEQLHEYRSYLSFEPFLRSLLERIESFAKTLKNGKEENKNRKVLIYLYAATLSKLQNVKKNKAGRDIIVDLDIFLDVTYNNFKP